MRGKLRRRGGPDRGSRTGTQALEVVAAVGAAAERISQVAAALAVTGSLPSD